MLCMLYIDNFLPPTPTPPLLTQDSTINRHPPTSLPPSRQSCHLFPPRCFCSVLDGHADEELQPQPQYAQRIPQQKKRTNNQSVDPFRQFSNSNRKFHTRLHNRQPVQADAGSEEEADSPTHEFPSLPGAGDGTDDSESDTEMPSTDQFPAAAVTHNGRSSGGGSEDDGSRRQWIADANTRLEPERDRAASSQIPEYDDDHPFNEFVVGGDESIVDLVLTFPTPPAIAVQLIPRDGRKSLQFESQKAAACTDCALLISDLT